MPTYAYRCKKCKENWDEFQTVEKRNVVECRKCKTQAIRNYAKTSTKFFPFKAMWYTDICETPLYIESKKQLKNECKKHGVIACRLL